jgi:hypothetical protein
MTLSRAEIVAMGDRLKAHIGKNDYVIVALGAHGPNIDMPNGNVLATVRMGADEATAEAKYLADAVTLARGIIVRKREAEAKKAKAQS